MLANIVFKGLTSVSLPTTLAPNGITYGLSANHWQTTDTLLTFIKDVDSFMQCGYADPEPWLLILDVATIHTSQETRRRLREEVPMVHLVYVPGRTTSFNQPLDRAVMRGFKVAMANMVAAHFASLVLDGLRKDEELSFDFGVKALKNQLPFWLRAAMDEIAVKKHFFDHGWAHLLNCDDAQVLEMADKHHAEGSLFRAVRRNCHIHEGMDPLDVASAPLAAPPDDDEVPEDDYMADAEEALLALEPELDEEPELGEPPEAELMPDEPAQSASSSGAASALSIAAPTHESVMSRVMALRLVYGRGPR